MCCSAPPLPPSPLSLPRACVIPATIRVVCRTYASRQAANSNSKKRDYNSPDSFERTLSQIADKIKRTSNKLAVLRQRARRYNGLLIFYGILGYLVYLVVLLLFFGYQNITPGQGGGLFGAPLGCVT